MKNYTLLLSFLCFSLSAFAQWTQTTSYPQYSLQTVFFVNDSTGYIAGNNGWMVADGVILKTTDSGNSWDSTHFNYGFISVYFPNKDTGYAVTTGTIYQQLYKTTDEGNSWSKTPGCDSSYSGGLKGLFFIDGLTGFLGAQGRIEKITNGGGSMTPQLPGAQSNIEAICFVNKDTGFAGGWYDAVISRTTDGGNTWTAMTIQYEIWGLYFPSELIGYAVGSNTIVKTTDGGNTWVQQVSGVPTNKPLLSIYCINDNICYAVGTAGTIIKTTDGGNSWLPQISGTTKNINSIFCTDNNTCYAAGDSGIVLKTTTGGVGINENKKKDEKISIYPNPATGLFHFNSGFKNQSLEIYNVLGEKVYSNMQQFSNSAIDFSHKPQGIYFIKVISGENIYTEKVVIE